MPRFHTTFGRPTFYENLSKEIEKREISGGVWREETSAIVSNKDRLIFRLDAKDHIESEITVLDNHGIKVVYKEALNDMLQLEEEMIKTGSFFLNKAEFLQHTIDDESPATMLDRGEITLDLLSMEFELQIVKIQLVEVLL